MKNSFPRISLYNRENTNNLYNSSLNILFII